MSLQTDMTLIPSREKLQIKLTMRNDSRQYEIFQQWTCSWTEHWRCDNNDIWLQGPFACYSNFVTTVILPPGKSYDTPVARLEMPKLKPGKTTVRFALSRNKSLLTSEAIERIYKSREARTYSNEERDLESRLGASELIWTPRQTLLIREEWITNIRPPQKNRGASR